MEEKYYAGPGRRLMAQASLRAVTAALALAAASPAMAQTAPGTSANDGAAAEDQTYGLQEIIVTAQKRAENLQTIPVAVTALDKTAIENLRVQSFNDLSGLAPNLTAVNSGSGSNPIVTLRGIVGGNVEPGKDNGVAMYLDGVYISRSTGAQFDVADLERVEVLRGPQGTLYGRNSTGGAINYITAGPKGEFYARQEVTVGNLGRLRTKTRLDLPKIGAFSVSGTFLHDERNGYVRNLEAGRVWNFSRLPGGFLDEDRTSVKRLGARNAEAALIAVRFAPEDAPVTVDYKFDWTRARYSNMPKQVLFDLATRLPRAVPATTERLDAIPMGMTTPEKLKVFGHNLTVTWDVTDNVQVKSITGYRGFIDEYSNDVAGGGFENYAPAPGRNYFEVIGIVTHERDRAFSQEVQVSYRSDRVDAIGGFYYFKQHTVTVNPLYVLQFLTPPNLPAPANNTDADNHNRSVAVFGQATVHVTPQLDVTGGVRGTRDTRRSSTTLTVTPDFRGKFERVDWTANVTYRPTSAMTLYAKSGTGYLSGGVFNQLAFEPEKLLQHEIGAKTDWLDRRLRINVAAFRSRYEDLQLSANNPNPPFLFQTFNVGKARITGAELEVTALPIDELTLSANYGYAKLKYRQFVHPTFGDITDLANPRFYRPRANLNLAAEYRLPTLSNGIQPSINVTARWHSNMEMYFLPLGYRMVLSRFPAAQVAQGAAIDRFTADNAVWDIDARATLAQIPVGGAKAKVSAWVKNALDKRKIANAAIILPGFVSGTFKEPRTYGLDVGVEF